MAFAGTSENVQRKADHIYAVLHEDVEFHRITSGFERYRFIHEALPEISLDDVDTSITLFERRLSIPFIISSMTGGTDEAKRINKLLAEAAQQFGVAMGVGSQRVALERPALEDTFRVRDAAPDILLFANLGAVQLNDGDGVELCVRAMQMIDADALVLHLNPLQECVQMRGNTDFHELAARISEVCDAFDAPVIVKEVGHGISKRTAELLVNAGMDGIDVAGAGGTSWAKVESKRNSDPALAALGTALGEWGIPTVDSLLAVREVTPHLPVIASGGVRSGEDIAKSIALGADAAGIALPLLKCAAQSRDALFEKIAELKKELAAVMFCTGSKSIEDLKKFSSLIKAGR